MVVGFTKELNVQTSTKRKYRDFIEELRHDLGVRSSHNRPALAVQQNPPTRFFDLVLRTNDHSVRFRLRSDNLYLLGYQMENNQWLEFGREGDTHLITEPQTNFLGFDGSYTGMERAANQSIQEMRVGIHNLEYAINQLAQPATSGQNRARALVVVIMMFCESTRLIPVFDYVAESFDNRPGTSRDSEGTIQPWITDLIRSWEYLSGALFRADAYPEERFRLRPNNIRIPPNNTEIRTIADVISIIGILLGLCFYSKGPRRLPRMASDDDDDDDHGECFLGVPLLQVFSVQINNIDGEDPGQLYGTIMIDNGLYTEFLYNRTSDNYESIKPGQNASLIGPSQSVTAFGNVNIKMLLTDKDTLSWDDVIIDQVISWDFANMGDVYDKLISQQLDSSRGSVTVNYAVLQNAAAARVTVTIEEGGETTTEIYGHVSACYDKWEDPKTTCLLFDRTSKNYVEVNRWQTIPLLRSVVAAPLDRSLKVTASLKDHNPISADDVIASGTVEIPVPETIPSNTFNRIDGEDGNYVTVTVYWSSGM